MFNKYGYFFFVESTNPSTSSSRKAKDSCICRPKSHALDPPVGNAKTQNENGTQTLRADTQFKALSRSYNVNKSHGTELSPQQRISVLKFKLQPVVCFGTHRQRVVRVSLFRSKSPHEYNNTLTRNSR